jgi:hypothetical protein
MKKPFLLGLLLSLASSFANARGVSDDLRFVPAIKHPNQPSEGLGAVRTFALTPQDDSGRLPGFSDLTDDILAAPDQLDAGTCLYMSLTGIMEWWVARLNPSLPHVADGPTDLSERFTVNTASAMSRTAGVKNWKTDTIEVFNKVGYGATNRSYRFTKGYYLDTDNGYVASNASNPEALFGTPFNWINEISTSHVEKVKLPFFKREVLFADPTGDQWHVGGAPADLADTIKRKLKERMAPVHVIYNHYGYWHATIVVGYDDEADTRDCHFVQGFRKYMKEHPAELRAKAQDASLSPERRREMINQARAQENTSRLVEAAWQRGGGCKGKGAFYVRDSIYGGDEQPVYDYNPAFAEAKGRYSKRLVNLEYEWITYLANHAVQIYVE